MSDPYVGEIKMFAGDFAPPSWELCHGQILQIEDNEVLFQILGNRYGGDGETTFALPDLRSRVAVGAGQGSGLTNVDLGEQSGSESVTLGVSNIPPLGFQPPVYSDDATSKSPVGKIPAVTESAAYAAANSANATGAQVTISTGGPEPFSIRPPYMGINYIICMAGVVPFS